MTIIEMICFSLLRIKRHKENIYFILIMTIFTIILLTALNVYYNINSFIEYTKDKDELNVLLKNNYTLDEDEHYSKRADILLGT